MMTHHLAMLIISYILGAPFPAMDPWTKKSPQESEGKPGAGQTPQPSAQATQHPAINETESLQCCGSPLPPLRL